MKKALLCLTALCLLCTHAFAKDIKNGIADATLLQTGVGEYTLQVKFANINFADAGNGWKKAIAEGLALNNAKGEPELPFASYGFMTGTAPLQVTIENAQYQDVPAINIIPSIGSVSRKVDPKSIVPVAGAAYGSASFFPSTVAQAGAAYAIRSAQGSTLRVYPVQFNPASKTARVYSQVTLKIKTGVVRKPADAQKSTWNTIYKAQFVNYDYTVSTAKTTNSVVQPVSNMLVITSAAYVDSLQAFLRWKMECGIRTHLLITDSIAGGATPHNIQTYIAANSQAMDLDYVLLVGDNADLPPVTDMTNSGLTVAGPSDAAYGYMTLDHYPDIIVGRFSVESLEDLSVQTRRTIEYEKQPTIGGAWYGKGIGIASNQGPGDDNEMDFEHIRNIRSLLTNVLYSDVDELYDGDQGGVDSLGDPNYMNVVNDMNNGVGIVNYCGHGWMNGIATTGFSSWDVPLLNNYNGQWPFFLVVGCQVGDFVSGTCFAEDLVRAHDPVNKKPAGSIVSFMSTINQYWSEPMQAQDIINDVITGNSLDSSDNLGVITMLGCASMNDDYVNGGYDMTDTWTYFGDPTLQFRKMAPTALTAQHIDSIYLTADTLLVSVNNPKATVTLIHADTMFSVQSMTGLQTHHQFAALPIGDSIFVSVTAPNAIPTFSMVYVIDTPHIVIPSAINQVNKQAAISIYPNPAQSEVFVNGIQHPATYQCLDVTGRVVLEGVLNSKGQSINVAKLSTGSYNIRLTWDGGQQVSPVIISR